MSTSEATWNTIYTEGTDWGHSGPSDVLWRFLDLIPSNAHVLDVGSGMGRNSLFFARHGHRVAAIDISSVALRLLSEKAAEEKLQIETKQADATEMRLPPLEFDLVMLYGVLNSLESTAWTSLIDSMKEATKSGGINILAYFNDYSPNSSIDGIEIASLAHPDFVLELYRDWQLIHHDSRFEWHAHGRRAPHGHATERIAFRKSEPLPPMVSAQPKVWAVIGPAGVRGEEAMGTSPPGALLEAARRVGELLANHGRQLLCIPDRGVGREAFLAYSSQRPKYPPLVIAPRDDDAFSESPRSTWLDALEFPAIVDKDLAWTDQARQLVMRADAVIVLGLSVGVMMEILWTKWFHRPIYMPLDIAPSLPREIRRDLTLFELPSVDALLDYIALSFRD